MSFYQREFSAQFFAISSDGVQWRRCETTLIETTNSLRTITHVIFRFLGLVATCLLGRRFAKAVCATFSMYSYHPYPAQGPPLRSLVTLRYTLVLFSGTRKNLNIFVKRLLLKGFVGFATAFRPDKHISFPSKYRIPSSHITTENSFKTK